MNLSNNLFQMSKIQWQKSTIKYIYNIWVVTFLCKKLRTCYELFQNCTCLELFAAWSSMITSKDKFWDVSCLMLITVSPVKCSWAMADCFNQFELWKGLLCSCHSYQRYPQCYLHVWIDFLQLLFMQKVKNLRGGHAGWW